MTNDTPKYDPVVSPAQQVEASLAEKKPAAASEDGEPAAESDISEEAASLMQLIAKRDFATPPELDKKNRPRFNKIDEILSYKPCHDHGNAERFLERNKKKILFVEKNGWFGWTGTHWAFEDGERRAQKAAYNTAIEMKKESLAYAARGMYDGEKPGDYIERIGKFRKFAHTSCNLSKLNAMLEIAETYVAREHDIMDTHKYLVTVGNGILNLMPKGDPGKVQLDKHDPDKFISKKMEVDYDPDARCEKFEAALAQILPDPEIRKFLQTWYGYSLCGSVASKAILIMQGEGDNGKSLLVELFNRIFGNYACGIPIESLMAQKNKSGSNASPDLARLPGARVVTAAEPDQGMQFSEGFLKTISGADKITVRRLHQDFFEFYAQFKLAIACNAKPQVRGGDEALWKRLYLIPFEQQFLAEHRLPNPKPANVHKADPELAAALWEERNGILNWMIKGFHDWKRDGLRMPEKMQAAVDEYRAENNTVLQFLQTWCDLTPGFCSERATDLFDAYELWAKEFAIEPMGKVGFGKKIKTLPNIKYERTGLGIFYGGVSLKDDAKAKLLAIRSGGARHAGEKAAAASLGEEEDIR